MRKIAFFDFDGTITKKDTLLEFIKFSKGSFLFYLGFLLNAHYMVAFKAKIISNKKSIERILQFFFKNVPENTFNALCTDFSESSLPQLIRPKAIDKINELKQKGFLVVIVSASPENWIYSWTNKMDVELIASKLEVNNGKLTGNICGNNCHGDEKVRRILENYQLSEFDEILAFGDTNGDRPMLKLAHNQFYKPFRN